MVRLVVRGLGARKLRSALTALAILLGVAMVSGTFVLTDQIRTAFDEVFSEANQGVDVVVTRAPTFVSQQSLDAGPIPESLVGEVAAVEGVDAAEGQVLATGALVVEGDLLDSEGAAPSLVLSGQGPAFDVGTLVAGSLRPGPGEVVVEAQVAERGDVMVGQRLGLATDVGLRPVEVVGILDYPPAAQGGFAFVFTSLADAQRWFDREGQVSLITLAAEPGVGAEELADRVEAVLPEGVRAQTGVENAGEQAETISDAIGAFLTPVLLALAGVAVVVGAFIIFNTFSITVAQRTRELAIARTLGASRRQVLTAVLGEAMAVAAVASVLGLLGGFLFAGLVVGLFDAAGFMLPTAAPALAPRTVAIGLAVGLGVTLLAALVPALRATRVPPVAAMREGATLPPSRFSRLAPYLGAALAVLGAVILVQGLVGEGSATERLFSLAGGALLVLVGAGPFVRYAVRPMAGAIGWPLERMFGGTARLARENAGRNPSRTAATAGALVVGVALIVLVTVVTRGFQESFTGALERQVKGELMVTGENFAILPAGAAETVRAVDGVAVAAPVGGGQVLVDGRRDDLQTINAIDPDEAGEVFNFDWRDDGSDALLAELTPDTALIESDLAVERGLEVGDTFAVTGLGGEQASLRVAGIYRDQQLFLGITLARAAYERLVPDPRPFLIVTQLAAGADPGETRTAVEAALEQFPVAEVQSRDEFVASIDAQVTQILLLLYALLAFSVVISLFGIVNTLVLSVLERTREIGMLRAIGTTRPQLRRIVRYESTITAVIGTVLGIGVGLVLGWLMTEALRDEGVAFAFPGTALVVVLVLAIVAGVLAGVLPARRAARLDVLEALKYE